MNKLEMIKGTVGLVVSIGTGTIVGNVINATTPASTHIVKKVCIGAASFVIGNIAGDVVVKYTEEKMDGLFENFKKPKKSKEVEA